MKSQRILPREQLSVVDVDRVAGVVRVKHDDATDPFTMSNDLANEILVRLVAS